MSITNKTIEELEFNHDESNYLEAIGITREIYNQINDLLDKEDGPLTDDNLPTKSHVVEYLAKEIKGVNAFSLGLAIGTVLTRREEKISMMEAMHAFKDNIMDKSVGEDILSKDLKFEDMVDVKAFTEFINNGEDDF